MNCAALNCSTSVGDVPFCPTHWDRVEPRLQEALLAAKPGADRRIKVDLVVGHLAWLAGEMTGGDAAEWLFDRSEKWFTDG